MALKEIILIFVFMLGVLVLTGTGYAMASQPAEEWNRTYKMNGITSVESFQQTADAGYILAGNTRSNAVFVLKTDPTGSEQWNRTFRETFSDDRVKSVLQTSDGGYIIAGETGSEGTDSYDVWLFRTDADGHVQWETTFGGHGHDMAKFVLLAPDGDLVVAGDTELHSEQRTDFWLAKLGGIPAEPEGGDAPTDGEPVQTPDMPGFSAAVAVMGLMVWVGLVGRQ